MKRNIFAVLAIIAIGCAIISCGNNDDGSGSDNSTVITIAAITGVTAPVSGETPKTTITETTQYTGTIAWKETISGNALSGTFAAAIQYTATITLKAKSGYTLTGVTENFFTVAGATSFSNAADSGVITALFPQASIIDLDDLCMYLTSYYLPDNTADTPYTITLNVNSFGSPDNLIEYAIREGRKYVCLDLSSSTLTSIPENAFYKAGWDGNSFLIGIIIPNTVSNIGKNAFRDCVNLTNITMPDSIVEIEEYAFYGCTSLDTVTIPENITYIRDYTFYGCTSLTNITMNGVGTIETYAFYGCTSLVSINIPNDVISIGDSAFRNCTSLVSITIPDNVTAIASYSFADCTSLTNVIIPNTVTSIGYYSFSNCTNLTNIIIPDSVTKIVPCAFKDCTNLISVTFESSTTVNEDGYTDSFPGDLWEKYHANDGGAGTYIRPTGSNTWTKQQE